MRLSAKKRRYIEKHAGKRSPEEIAKKLGLPVEVVRKVTGSVARGAAPAASGSTDKVAGPGLAGDAPAGMLPILERAPFRVLVFLAAAAPFVIVPGLRDYSNMPRSALIELTVLAIIGLWLAAGALRGDARLRWSPVALPVAALIGWALVSILWAQNRYEAYLSWTRWASCGVVVFAVAGTVRNPRRFRWLTAAVFASGCGIALLGVVQHLFRFRWMPQPKMLAPTLANTNFAAHYVVATLPLGVGLLLSPRLRRGARGSWKVWGAAYACGVMVLFLYYSLNKCAMVAFAAQAVLIAALLIRERRRPDTEGPAGGFKRMVAPLAATGVLVIVMMNVSADGFRWTFGDALDEASILWHRRRHSLKPEDRPTGRTAEARYYSSVTYRLIIWGNTLAMIRDHALRGVGIGNWKVEYPRYSASFAPDVNVGGNREALHPHNDYLQLFAELGLVGVGLVAWVGVAVVRTLARALRRESYREARHAAIYLGAGTLALAVVAGLSFPLDLPATQLVLAMYLGLAGGALAGRPEGGSTARRLRVPSWAGFAAAAVLGIVFVAHARAHYRRMAADRHFMAMDRAHKRDSWPEAIARGKKAYAYNPHRKKTLVTIGGAYVHSGKPGEAVPGLEEALRAYPYDLKTLSALGVAHTALGEFDKAREYLESAIEMRPDYADGHNYMASLFLNEKKLDEAAASMDKAVRHAPRSFQLLMNAAYVHMQREDLGRGLEFYARAAEAKPEDKAAPRFIAGIAGRHLAERRWAEAHEAYLLAAKYAPEDARNHFGTGVAAFGLKRPREAARAFERALKLRPEWAHVHAKLGMILY
ncbi:MAG: O-antigen ligase family protein, partial [Planctomycetota bacterium]